MSAISRNIKRLRQKSGLTQDELAEKLHVTRQAVSNWENDKNQPDLDMLKDLAEVLCVDIKEIIYEPEPVRIRQRKWMIAGILCVLATVIWAVYFPLRRWTMAWRAMTFITKWDSLCAFTMYPLAVLLSGAALAALLSVWHDISPRTKKIRYFLFGVGLAALLAYSVMVFLSFQGTYQAYYVVSKWRSRLSWTFVVLGVALFYGWPRKAG